MFASVSKDVRVCVCKHKCVYLLVCVCVCMYASVCTDVCTRERTHTQR